MTNPEKLFTEHQDLAPKMAAYFYRRHRKPNRRAFNLLPKDERRAIAMEALWKACVAFPGPPEGFTKYASVAIYRALMRALKRAVKQTKERQMPQTTTGDDVEYASTRPGSGKRRNGGAYHAPDKPPIEVLRDWVETLPDRERSIVELRANGLSYSAVGTELGLSETMIRKLVANLEENFRMWCGSQD